jgi:hypothetical protein
VVTLTTSKSSTITGRYRAIGRFKKPVGGWRREVKRRAAGLRDALHAGSIISNPVCRGIHKLQALAGAKDQERVPEGRTWFRGMTNGE